MAGIDHVGLGGDFDGVGSLPVGLEGVDGYPRLLAALMDRGWSEGDIATYLETGFTPDFDSVGGSMVEVQKNMAKLPASDREAIAAYLKAVPAVQ